MKISVSKDFGTAKKPVLPLVPKTTTVNKKEDLAQVDLTQLILEGGTETAREVIQWMQNVERAFAELNSNTGTLREQMMQPFARGSALSGFNANATQLATPTRFGLVWQISSGVDGLFAQAILPPPSGGDHLGMPS